MQHKLLVPAVAIVIALSQALAVSAARIEVAEPLIRFASTESRLHEMCGAGRFDACTLFVGFALRVDCVNDSSAVRMHAEARVTPWILVLNMRKAPHEMEHIRDVAQDLVRYVGDLERVEFVSTADCHAAALTAQSRFGETIRAFSRSSSARMNEPLR